MREKDSKRRNPLLKFWRRLTGAIESSTEERGPPSGAVADPRARSSSVSTTIQPPRRRSPSKHREQTDVVLGLDFGTSCTKVVVRSPYVGGGRAVAVPFSDMVGEGYSYLLPTALEIGGDGCAVLCPRLPSGAVPLSLKVDLMDRPDDLEVRARAAAYLALVMRHARSWFSATQGDIFSDYELDWQVNIGIPSAGYDDERMRVAFQRVASSAWKTSLGDRPVDFERVRNQLEIAKGDDFDEYLGVIPEVAAEVVGYARSSYRSPGLHLLVDIGATTVDVCGFILHEREGDDAYELLTASVDRHGVHELHRHRLREIAQRRPSDIVKEIDLSDPMTRIPESASDYVATKHGETNQFQSIDEGYRIQCVNRLMSVLDSLHRRRYHTSPRWSEGLPVFLCGGGASMAFYQRVSEAASDRCQNAWGNVAPFDIRILQRPPQLANEDLSPDIYLRLAVAYGLSFDRFAIGKITPPHEIEDLPPPQRRSALEYVSKDQV